MRTRCAEDEITLIAHVAPRAVAGSVWPRVLGSGQTRSGLTSVHNQRGSGWAHRDLRAQGFGSLEAKSFGVVTNP